MGSARTGSNPVVVAFFSYLNLLLHVASQLLLL